MGELLTSLQNARVKHVVRLRQRRAREREGRFAVEGWRELNCAADAGVTIETVFHCDAFHRGEHERELVRRLGEAGAELQATSSEVFRKMSYRQGPDGLLGIAAAPCLALGHLAVPNDGLWLVVESIEKPGNLGAMLRSADATGAGVIVADPTTDVFNPNVIRVSIGTLFTVPLAMATGNEVRAWLHKHAVAPITATPEAPVAYTDADLTRAIALVIGSEHAGLTDAWREADVTSVSIPMSGHANSVNAAMAATILLFEARRQRN
ncbi:MAG: RNA methyltransferase [Gammaproteobacteria bacterium]|nr:RNA methyltransferase [Gammaproteobacteria bacterium]